MTQETRLPGATSYMQQVQDILDMIRRTQGNAIERAAAAVVRSVENDGMVYLFGTGHSHLLAEEGHYRAGGLAAICPVLSTALMLHEGAVVSTLLERTSGIGPAVLSRYNPTEQDTLIIFSNSGVNAVPVEAALAAKETGMTVIAVIAADYAQQVPAGPTGKKLSDVADIVIDNQGPPGDALVDIRQTGIRVGPVSTIAGAFLLNAILAEAAWRLAATQATPPVYISANIPGSGEHNVELVRHYRPRNPHL
jgi:uncharacterized phosphosugar-binding protein